MSSFAEPPAPAQCSMWFAPSHWSARYGATFFTSSVVSASDGAKVLLRAGVDQWEVELSVAQMEQMLAQLQGELASAKHAFTPPPFPSSRDAASLDSWMAELLGGSRPSVAIYPSVRAALQLDRQLTKEEEEDDDDEEQQEQEAQPMEN